jgi:hypothetical protein
LSKSIRALSLAAAAGLTIAGHANAQAPEDDSGLRANCVADYFRYCSGYMPGSTAIRQCFARNIDRLTVECREAIHNFDRRYPKRS